MDLKKLLDNNNDSLNKYDIDFLKLEKVKNIVSDKLYFDLIVENTNGGYFFDNSLHLYGYCNTPSYHNTEDINRILQKEYGEIIGNMFCFGQDVFGNQFGFESHKVYSFNIETGEKELLAKNFESWLILLYSDLDYLTGRDFVTLENKLKLVNSRLCPKTPFIIGGEYNNDNFYVQHFPEYIKVNANIARQVYNLEEGTKVSIKITD